MTPRLRIKNNIIWYDIWKNIDTSDVRNDKIEPYLLEDLTAVGLDIRHISNFSWIINSGWEGYNSKDVEHFRKLLLHYGLRKTNFGALFVTYEDTAKLPYPAVCLPDRMVLHANWYRSLQKQKIDWTTLPMTALFTVLMRRASISRCHLAKRILEQYDPSSIIISLGINPGKDAQEYSDIISPHQYPLVVDKAEVPWPEDNIHLHDSFYRSPLNVVVESSHETDHNVWRGIFITEKTYKALSWYQFPIWYAVPGLVQKVREQGFDVFDDIIDHGYDNEFNPWVRMVAVVEQLKKIVDKDCNLLRKKHWERLESNAKIVQQIHTNGLEKNKIKTNRFLDEIQQLHQ